MDYTPPALCIRSITPSDTVGKVILDMPSIWRESNSMEVNKEVVDLIIGRYEVPMCPTGWPNPPTTTTNVE